MQGRMVERREVRPDGIGEPALLAHFAEQAGGEHAAAENVVHDDRCDPIRILAGEAGSPVTHRGLRDRQFHDLARADALGGDVRHVDKLRLCGQRREDPVELRCKALGVDGSDHADLQRIAREEALAEVFEIVARDRRQALQGPVGRPAIGMAGISRLEEGLARHRVRIVHLVPDARFDLRAHPLQRLGVEPRLLQAQAQHVEGFRAVFHQRAQMG